MNQSTAKDNQQSEKQKPVDKLRFEWKVEQQISSDKQYSEWHEYSGGQWRLLTFANSGKIALFLECDKPTCARFTLIYKDHRMVAKHKYTPSESDWGFNSFLHAEEFGPENEFAVEVEIIAESQLHRPDYHSKTETGYVGIQNQGATCYMNSLLQSLFYTNEFRRSVYHVKSEKKLVIELQRLFYLLQTEDDAVDTRELTKSFGWNSMDAFMQHDVQEFNRVLQDALEKEMDGTIERLFTGKMSSYIKCINVDYRSQREETYYDIQLNVKGMNSLEESFKDYIQTETLSGDNQYQSEKFGLQDAVKGVIFKSFPPILHLQLKRFEYDFQRDAMVKINDRFQFPEHIDLQPYLDPEVEQLDQKYTCYGVLVHAGDVHGGHYIAYIQIDGQWFKFNDDLVTKASLKDVYDENFGGDTTLSTQGAVRTKAQLLKKFTNAYMLVYIRDRDADSILKPLSVEEIPQDLRQKYEVEKQQREAAELEFKERHLYCQVSVLRDADFAGHQGFDLFDLESLQPSKVLRETSMKDFCEQHGGELWAFQRRNNKTVRLEGPVDQTQTVGLFWTSANRSLSHIVPLYQPSQKGSTDSSSVFIFIKYFDGQTIEVLGGVRVNQNLKGVDLVPILNQLKNFSPGTSLKVYEEIKPGMVESLRMSKTLAQSEVGTGDILVFQKEGISQTAVQYFDFVANKLVIPFKAVTGDQEFEIEVSRKITHDQLQARVAQELQLDKPDRLRFWVNPTGGPTPKVIIKRQSNMTLQEIQATVMYNDARLFVWFEVLEMSAADMEQMKTIHVVLLDKHYREKDIVPIMINKHTGTVADLVKALKAKHPSVPIIRVLEVQQSRRLTTLAPDHSLAMFADYSSQLCIETEIYNDPDIACKSITVFHFNREVSHSAWGVPVVIHVRPGITVAEFRTKVKDRLAIHEKEMAKMRMFLVVNSQLKLLEDTQVLEFTDKDQIALDHVDKRRTQQAERSIKIG